MTWAARTWRCPWCNRMTYLAARPRHEDAAWHRLSPVVFACENCHQPVRTARSWKAWAAFLAPWVLLVVAAAARLPLNALTAAAMAALGAAGLWAFDSLAWLEKETLLPADAAHAQQPATRAGRFLAATASMVLLLGFFVGAVGLVMVVLGAATGRGQGDMVFFMAVGCLVGLPGWIAVAVVSIARRHTTRPLHLALQNLPPLVAFALLAARMLSQ